MNRYVHTYLHAKVTTKHMHDFDIRTHRHLRHTVYADSHMDMHTGTQAQRCKGTLAYYMHEFSDAKLQNSAPLSFFLTFAITHMLVLVAVFFL